MPATQRPAAGTTSADGVRASQAQQVRQRLLGVAAVHFRRYGFDRTSLAEVGAEVGLTRGAVLYHFGSKASLLAELVRPFTDGLDAALDDFESITTPPDAAAVIDTTLELLIATRAAADLFARDIASRHALELDNWFTTSTGRLVDLLAPGEADDTASRALGYSALGALIRPLTHLPDPIDDATRAAIHDAALRVLTPRRPTRRLSAQ